MRIRLQNLGFIEEERPAALYFRRDLHAIRLELEAAGVEVWWRLAKRWCRTRSAYRSLIWQQA